MCFKRARTADRREPDVREQRRRARLPAAAQARRTAAVAAAAANIPAADRRSRPCRPNAAADDDRRGHSHVAGGPAGWLRAVRADRPAAVGAGLQPLARQTVILLALSLHPR